MKTLIRLKPFVNDQYLWEAFEDYIKYELEGIDRKLEQETDLLRIGRAQGEAALLRRLLKLREHANGAGK